MHMEIHIESFCVPLIPENYDVFDYSMTSYIAIIVNQHKTQCIFRTILAYIASEDGPDQTGSVLEK